MTNLEFYNKIEKVTMNGRTISTANITEFKNAVVELCRIHNVTILHEDIGGGFQVVNGYEEDLIQWFLQAYDPNATRINRKVENSNEL